MEQSPNMPQYRMHCGTSGNCLQLFASCSCCGTGVLHVRMYPPGGVKLQALCYLVLSQELLTSVCTLG
jgi:hypothetical protein